MDNSSIQLQGHSPRTTGSFCWTLEGCVAWRVSSSSCEAVATLLSFLPTRRLGRSWDGPSEGGKKFYIMFCVVIFSSDNYFFLSFFLLAGNEHYETIDIWIDTKKKTKIRFKQWALDHITQVSTSLFDIDTLSAESLIFLLFKVVNRKTSSLIK